MTSTPISIEETPSRLRQGARNIVLLVVLATVSYAAAYLWTQPSTETVLRAVQSAGCDLHQNACTATFDDGRVIQLELEPKAVSPAEPVRLFVETTGFAADSVTVEFAGVDMNMGTIETELLDTGASSFTGDSILPVCIRRTMTWQAKVTARGNDNAYQGIYTFTSSRR